MECRTLPVLLTDIVWRQDLKPEVLPWLFFIGRWSLRPNILMVLEVSMKANCDAAHVGNAGGFLGAQVKLARIRDK